jgi:hypothetical protein
VYNIIFCKYVPLIKNNQISDCCPIFNSLLIDFYNKHYENCIQCHNDVYSRRCRHVAVVECPGLDPIRSRRLLTSTILETCYLIHAHRHIHSIMRPKGPETCSLQTHKRIQSSTCKHAYYFIHVQTHTLYTCNIPKSTPSRHIYALKC